MDDVKAETGAKGKDLFHPVRVVLIGSHSGPAFDKLIPLLEDDDARALTDEQKTRLRRAVALARATDECTFQMAAVRLLARSHDSYSVPIFRAIWQRRR